MKSLRIKQEFYLVFLPFDRTSGVTTFFDKIRFRALSWFFDREKQNFYDFGHVYIFLKKNDVLACLSRTMWGYFLDVEKINLFSDNLLDNEEDLFLKSLKQNHGKSNAIVKVKTHIKPQMRWEKTIHSGNLCHILACNVLAINRKAKSPFDLYKFLVKNGCEVIKEY
jgi:hypothetical protein